MWRTLRWGTLVAVTLLLLTDAVTAAGPRTLITTARPINAFVQDGDHIAWSVCDGDPLVWVRTLSKRSMRSFSSSSPCDPNGATYGGWGPALAGTRVIWDAYEVSKMDSVYEYLLTASLGDPTMTGIDSFYDAYYGSEPWDRSLGPMAGHGRTLIYSVLWADCPSGPASCLVGGNVRRVNGRRASIVPGAPPAAVLAVSEGRIAIAPAATYTSYEFGPARGGPVEIRNASTGSLIRSIAFPGKVVRALALTPTTLAVLTADTAGNRRIVRYSVATGDLVGATWVRRTTADELDMAGRRIVYRTGNAIRLLDAVTGTKTGLWTTKTPPIGVSIEGQRVAWAVNIHPAAKVVRDGRASARRGRIFALSVPTGQ
jgi:hypothetical protein